MTNIVGGNTGNLSQPGSSQDGSSSNPLSKNATLDFLSLLSVVYEGQKGANAELSKPDNAEKSLNITDPNVSLDLPKGERIISQIENQVSSDDISEFIKGLNVNSNKDGTNVGFSTLQLLGHLSKTEEVSPIKLNNITDEITKDFIKELLLYTEINDNKSDQALTRETSDIIARLQNIDEFQGENPDMLNFIKFDPNDTYTFDIKNSERSAAFVSLKKLSFTDLSNAKFLYEQNDRHENINKTSFLFNTDISDEENLSEKKVIEIKVTQNPDLFAVKVFDISDSKLKIAGDVIYLSGTEPGISQLDKHNNTLNVSIPNEDLAAIVLNVDVDKQGNTDFIPLPVALKPSETFQTLYQRPSVSINADENTVKEIFKVLPTSRNSITGALSNLELGNLNETLISADKTNSNDETINFPLRENSTKNNFKISDDTTNMALLSSKSQFLNDEQMQFVVEKLQKTNGVAKQDLVSGNQITEFILRRRGNFSIDAAISKVMKTEFKTAENTSTKKNLFISTADVIGYRNVALNSSNDRKLIVSEYSYFDKPTFIPNALGMKGEPELSNELEFPLVSNFPEIRANAVQSAVSGNRIDQILQQPQISANILTPQKLSVLDAQFTSRLATTLLEQAVNSKENFDLILEPESFGRVRVNVSLENLQLDVKLTAENSAALAVLRASEGVLQAITEINGLKLAEYNVELSNNNQNNNGSREQKENSSGKGSKMNENQSELDDKLDSSNDDGSHNLNLIA